MSLQPNLPQLVVDLTLENQALRRRLDVFSHEPTYGHCYVTDSKAGCGYVNDGEQRCGGLLSHHEAEHWHGGPTVPQAFEVIRAALRLDGADGGASAHPNRRVPRKGVKIENSQTNEEAFGFERIGS